MLSERTRAYLTWIGSVLSLIALLFVIRELMGHTTEVDFSRLGSMALPLMCLSLLYGGASVFLALAWWNLVRHFALPLDKRLAIHIYGMSQLSKYVPGNVFQFVGRQALGLNAGLPMWPLAKSTVWEIALLAASAGLFSVLVLPNVWLAVPVPVTAALFGFTVAAALWIANHGFGAQISRAMGWYVAFHALSALSFLAVTSLVVPQTGITATTSVLVCGAYIVAWLAGFATPGAPAGVGIREFVLLLLLKSTFSEAEILAAIVLGRLVTIGGDVFFFLLALGCKPRLARGSQA